MGRGGVGGGWTLSREAGKGGAIVATWTGCGLVARENCGVIRALAQTEPLSWKIPLAA